MPQEQIGTPADVPLQLDDTQLNALGEKLSKRFLEFKNDRSAAEATWLKNLRQYLGEYDPEMLQKMQPDRSRAYPKLTRVKVVSMVSRLMSLLFPTSEKNWGLHASKSPTFDVETVQQIVGAWEQTNQGAALDKKELKRILGRAAAIMAEKMELEIDDQLMDIGGSAAMDYVALVRKVVFSAVLYGPGILKGPMTIMRKQGVYDVTATGVEVSEQDVLRPYYEFVPCWDYYPDLSAKTFDQMDGRFQRHVMSRHQLRQLADRSDFMGDRIKKYLVEHTDGNYKQFTYEAELDKSSSSGGVKGQRRKFEVIEFWGYVFGHELRGAGVDIKDEDLSDEVRATLWMIDDVVIKAALDPFPAGVSMYHEFVFEEDEVNLMGSGLPPICRDSQLGVCAATRMLIDNASVVCGPQLEVNLDVVRIDQDTKGVQPFKVWYTEGGVSGASGQAVRNIAIDSHISELMSITDMFMAFSDKETFVSPATNGDMENSPSEPMRTSSGASMILGNAALPFRDIVRNFDRFTMSVIHSLVEWNTLFNADADVKGDLQPVARGATSLIAKEVRAMALDNLALTLREEEAMFIDMKELAKARISVRDLPLDRLLLSDEEVARNQQAAAQKAQQQEDLQNESINANIRKVLADAYKATSQAQKNLDGSDVAVFNAVLNSLREGMDPNVVKGFVANPTDPAIQQPASPGVDTGQDVGAGVA